MRQCLKSKEVTVSWGISNIKITDKQIYFNVDGFNYDGQIKIRVNTTGLDIYSSKGHIGYASDAMHALQFLDAYIELNGESYRGLMNRINF